MRPAGTMFLGRLLLQSPGKMEVVGGHSTPARQRCSWVVDRQGIDPMTAPDSLAELVPEDHQGRGRENGGSLRAQEHPFPILLGLPLDPWNDTIRPHHANGATCGARISKPAHSLNGKSARD